MTQPSAPDERDECLDAETLAAYLDGLLPADAVSSADRHIGGCGACRAELSALAATFPEGSGGERALDDVVDGALAIGPRLGRYEVLGELGRGNMGVVVRGYDPELQRAVAIKVLAPKLWHGAGARERLLREAQALARLSHPNVVQVYDVTAHGDVLAIAMELVEGSTLRAAIGGPWREVLAACIAAGRGLAAAHAARLIHRDFKPENVLCAGERVVVSDFGLARTDDVAVPPAGARTTATTLAGTPAYMAPELLRGEVATASSDQFSFCVTTYEALYGERPFAGATLPALRAAMQRSEVRAAPAGARVPARIRAALVRGLAAEPERRWASMAALLDALAAPPRRARWWVAGAAVAAVAVPLVLALRPAAASCERAFAWDRWPVLGALGVDGVRLAAAIDRYGDGWTAARRDACSARGEQSAQAVDARFACLDRGAREVRELIELARAEPGAAAHVLEAVPRVRDPASCNGDALDAAIDPRLDHANALLGAGKTAEALPIADAVIASHPAAASLAEALLLRGRIESGLGKVEAAEATFLEAVTAAEHAHADQLVGTVWVELVQVTGAQLHHFDAAEAHMRAAEAAFARADPGPAVRGRFAYVAGATHLAAGKIDQARTDLQRALAIADPADHGLAQAALCDVERNAGHADAARAHCQAAIDLISAAFGPDHPQLAPIYNTWGAIEVGARKPAAARAMFAKAIALWERAHIDTDRGLALALSNTATTYMDEDNPAAAQPLFERARDLFAAHHPDHPQRALPLQGLAAIALERGDMPHAIALYEEALAVIERAYGKDSEDWLVASFNLALTYERVPDAARAGAMARDVTARALHPGRENWRLAAYGLQLQATLAKAAGDLRGEVGFNERALAVLDAHPDPYLRALVAQNLGIAYRATGKVRASVPLLEAAVAYYDRDRTDRYASGTARFALARSLWDTGDLSRARSMARAASDTLAAAQTGYHLAEVRRELAGWLATH